MRNTGKRLKVIGGFKEKHEQGEGEHKKVWSVFTEKVSVVIEEKDLAALFRRDSNLCGMGQIKIEETNEQCTPGIFFSEMPLR